MAFSANREAMRGPRTCAGLSGCSPDVRRSCACPSARFEQVNRKVQWDTADVTIARFLRLAVAVALTAYVLWRAKPGDVAAVAAGADWQWIAAAIGLILVDRTLMAYRWTVLLCALTPGSRPPFRAVMRIFFVSTFVGSFLPSVGGDLYRAYSLSRLQVSGVESAASVLMDRILGVLSMVLVAIVAGLTEREILASPFVLVALSIASAACGIAAVAVFSSGATAIAQAIAARIPAARARRLGTGLIEAIRRYARHHRELANVLLVSVVVQIIRVIQAYCLGRALGLGAAMAAYFAFIPIAMLIMQVPITVQGLGTGQAAFAWLFGTVGTSPAEAVALSILFVALGIVGNLPGGFLYAFGSTSDRPEAPVS
jgi:uncharacterized protein (TIRG00374 family)